MGSHVTAWQPCEGCHRAREHVLARFEKGNGTLPVQDFRTTPRAVCAGGPVVTPPAASAVFWVPCLTGVLRRVYSVAIRTRNPANPSIRSIAYAAHVVACCYFKLRRTRRHSCKAGFL